MSLELEFREKKGGQVLSKIGEEEKERKGSWNLTFSYSQGILQETHIFKVGGLVVHWIDNLITRNWWFLNIFNRDQSIELCSFMGKRKR